MRRLAILVPVLVGALAFPATAEDYSSLLRGPQCKPFDRGPDQYPYWARRRRMTVLVDSVLLSGGPALRAKKPCWRVHLRGRPAWMLRVAASEIRRSERRFAPLVVIGLGYNSLWEHHRRNFGRWSKRFDAEARSLLRVLRRRGARQFVWVTLRRPTRRNVPSSAWDDLGEYSWYFGYVNERLHRLDRRRDDLVLANWAKASKHRNDVTYDTIHLNQDGGRLMARTIRKAIAAEARAQVRPGPRRSSTATDDEADAIRRSRRDLGAGPRAQRPAPGSR